MNSSVSGKKFGWSNEVKAFRVKCEEVCMCLKCVFESLLSAAALTNTTELKISRYVCERVLMQAVRGCNVVGVSGAWVSHVSVHRRQFDTSASPPERNSQQLSGRRRTAMASGDSQETFESWLSKWTRNRKSLCCCWRSAASLQS